MNILDWIGLDNAWDAKSRTRKYTRSFIYMSIKNEADRGFNTAKILIHIPLWDSFRKQLKRRGFEVEYEGKNHDTQYLVKITWKI